MTMPKGASNQEEKRNKIVMKKIAEDMEAEFFHDEFHEGYVKIPVPDSHSYRIMKLDSRKFKQWMKWKYWKSCGVYLSDALLKKILGPLQGEAIYEGQEHKLHLRIAWHKENIFYDLGREKDMWAIEIKPRSWTLVKSPPILFRRYSHMKEQVIPASRGSAQELLNFMNVEEERKDERLLLLILLISYFIPDIPRPLLALHGDPGSTKTSVMMVLREVIDPDEKPISAPPRNMREFAIHANHNYCVFLDNLSRLPEWLSDALCRLVTGEGYSERKLYTDEDEIIFKYKRAAAISGVNVVINRGDLFDRTLIFELQQPKVWKEEKKLQQEFSARKSYILGGIFDVLAGALWEYPQIKLGWKSRMADFTRWGCAIARALGFNDADFLKAYRENLERKVEEITKMSPVAQTLLSIMEEREEWSGTIGKLHTELSIVADTLAIKAIFPKDATRLGMALTEIRATLSKRGIEIERKEKRTAKGYEVIIKKVGNQVH